jgi:ATP-dependent RNA helicase RhlE
MLKNPVRINVERQATPATGVTHAVLPVPERLKASLLVELFRRDEVRTALVFTRTKHRANRLALHLGKAGISCDRIHGNRSQPQREAALSAFKRGHLRVLVATDLASRGIDLVDLPHVINFDVPAQVDDYIHRVGRTARAEATGNAVTLAAPGDEQAIAAIEHVVGRRIPRRTLEGFNYADMPAGNLEVPIAERIAAIRAQKAGERTRARANAERRSRTGTPSRSGGGGAGSRPATAAGHGNGAHRRSSNQRRGSGR